MNDPLKTILSSSSVFTVLCLKCVDKYYECSFTKLRCCVNTDWWFEILRSCVSFSFLNTPFEFFLYALQNIYSLWKYSRLYWRYQYNTKQWREKKKLWKYFLQPVRKFFSPRLRQCSTVDHKEQFGKEYIAKVSLENRVFTKIYSVTREQKTTKAAWI